MAQEGFNRGLRLKIAGRSAAPAAPTRPEGVDVALTRALGKAGAPFDGLALTSVPDPPQWDIRPPAIVAALPAGALVVMLEAGGEARGLCALDHGLVDALIEVQTTGRVDRHRGAARPPTRIDAALTRDFLGLFLGALAGELSGRAGVDWPLALGYGAYLADPAQLDLLLPDRAYHLFSAQLDLGQGAKTGRLLLAAPVIGAAAPPAADPMGAGAAAAAWGRAWREALLPAPVALEAVLLRRTLTLERIEALRPGDVLSFDRADVHAVEIRDATGRVRFRARLGRAGGRRAVRLTGGAGLCPPKPPPQPPPETAKPPAPQPAPVEPTA